MQLTRIYKRKCFDISVFLGTMSVSISIVNILRKAIAAPVVAGAVSLGSKIPLALPSDLDRWQIALLLYLYLYHFIIRYLWSAISSRSNEIIYLRNQRISEKFLSSDEDKPQSIYTAHLIASYLSVTPLISSICSNLSARLGLVVALLGLWSLVEGRAPRKGRVRQQVDHFPVNIGFVSLSNIQSIDSTHFD